MPGGVPVGTLAVGEAGAKNAGLLAAQILALNDPALASRVEALRAAQTDSVPDTTPLPLGSTIGILGDGQLGRMLSQAASRLGFKVVTFGPDVGSPAAQVSLASKVAAYTDEAVLARLAERCDVITFEFENVPADSLDFLTTQGAVVAPSSKALRITQDRAGIGTVDFFEVSRLEDLEAAMRASATPEALLKTRREGYDGKGQVWVRSLDDCAQAWATLGGRPSILETKASFTREISVVAARGWDGSVKTFPIGENHHVGGILSTTLAPAQ
eukprot:gene35855-45891_t